MWAAKSVSLVTQYGTSSQTIALGNVEGPYTHAANVFENPAGLGSLEQSEYSVMNTTLADNLSTYTNFAAAYVLKTWTIGVGFAQVQVPGLAFQKKP